MQTFGKTASRLSRNPLGILALFLVLVYGFACIVVGFGSKSLNESERFPLIWFLVLFPILVLWVFYLLVTRHHRKLYAPVDFKDEKFFVTPLPEEVIQERVDEKVSAAVASQQMPLNEAVLSSRPSQATTQTLRNSYLEAEKLAFKALEKDIGFPIQQQVSVKGSHYDFGFDGLAIVKRTLHFFEVKYFQRPAFKQEFIEAALHRVASVAFSPSVFDSDKYNEVIFHLVIVVGFRDEKIEEFAKKLKSRIRSELFTVEYHFYDLDDLRRKFDKNP